MAASFVFCRGMASRRAAGPAALTADVALARPTPIAELTLPIKDCPPEPSGEKLGKVAAAETAPAGASATGALDEGPALPSCMAACMLRSLLRKAACSSVSSSPEAVFTVEKRAASAGADVAIAWYAAPFVR